MIEKKDNNNATVITTTDLAIPTNTESYNNLDKPVKQYIFTVNQVLDGMYDNNINVYENDSSIVCPLS